MFLNNKINESRLPKIFHLKLIKITILLFDPYESGDVYP